MVAYVFQVVGGAVVFAAATEEGTPEEVLVVEAEAEEAWVGGGAGTRLCPPLKNWMPSLTPMSTRSTSEVIGGQEWRPSSSSSIIWVLLWWRRRFATAAGGMVLCGITDGSSGVAQIVCCWV